MSRDYDVADFVASRVFVIVLLVFLVASFSEWPSRDDGAGGSGDGEDDGPAHVEESERVTSRMIEE